MADSLTPDPSNEMGVLCSDKQKRKKYTLPFALLASMTSVLFGYGEYFWVLHLLHDEYYWVLFYSSLLGKIRFKFGIGV